ncbi:hypothetical protein [Agarilytica rhodophyticola]|uniref:hypothetical protein n=1 Tax=Agarilytica rhodophyticola TaxID=1737490 RepID=UPI000B3425B1|nr:hypothetical protein [Agarilytica rhodophyticola]
MLKTSNQPPVSGTRATAYTNTANLAPTSGEVRRTQSKTPVMIGSNSSQNSMLTSLTRDTLQGDIANRQAQGLHPLPKHDLQRQIIDAHLQAKGEGIAPGDNSLQRQISKEEWQGARGIVNAITTVIAAAEMVSPSTLPSASDGGSLGVSLPGHVRIPIPPTQAEDLNEAAKKMMNERPET